MTGYPFFLKLLYMLGEKNINPIKNDQDWDF